MLLTAACAPVPWRATSTAALTAATTSAPAMRTCALGIACLSASGGKVLQTEASFHKS